MFEIMFTSDMAEVLYRSGKEFSPREITLWAVDVVGLMELSLLVWYLIMRRCLLLGVKVFVLRFMLTSNMAKILYE